MLYESIFYNVQVLSTTVAKALRFIFKYAAEETAKFVETADKLFDCFNVSSFSQGKKKRKPFQHLQPYRNKPYFEKDPDFRLEVIILFVTTLYWFVLQFLKKVQTYLDDWKESVTSRKGFKKHEQKQMMLSSETQCAIQILDKSKVTVTMLATFCVVSSFTEFLPYIFKIKGVPYFLSKNYPKILWKFSLVARSRKEGPTRILQLVNC